MYDNDNNYTYTANYSPEEPEPPKGGKAGRIAAFVLSVALIGGASGFGGAFLANSMNTEAVRADASAEETYTTAETTGEPIQTVTAPQKPDVSASIGSLLNVEQEGGETSTKDAIKKATPSVTLITSKFTEAGAAATGTGIVISADGYILTNCHVIQTSYQEREQTSNPFVDNPFGFFGGGYSYVTKTVIADEVTITLSDGSEHIAEVVGSDEPTDLALLKIDVKGLIPAVIGDSDALEMGDEVLTLGYPLGLGLSASRGIVSGLDKEVTMELSSGKTADMVLIQTDAAINEGNSGGPLLNANGEVIGITSSKIGGSKIDSVGFAIPITNAMSIIGDLRDKGYVAMPKMGIVGMEITPTVKRYYNTHVDEGVLIESVEAGSCAEAAGLEEGDIIVAADGKEISNMNELVATKNKHKPGETMTVTLARKDGNIDVTLTLDEEPRQEDAKS